VGAALRAGKPSILLPQITPQELFAQMLRREFLSAGAYDVRTLDAASLAAAIDRAVRDPRITGSAGRWQRAIRTEGGVDAAAAMIDAHAASLAGPSA
jgi:UDP:flavonoid glycosyltransferase YjiC (YdhE family)